ncbi:MAG: flagellin [Rhodospirillales bacterium]|nr:MAG: flagellin [Rhodospirillales bacterium]
MSEVALSAAMRSNLLTLQSTQRNMDGIQFNLATGRKVNSALDNPQSFFAAQALSNRATDLSRLLDGMGQAISTLKQADNGVTSLTKMVQQADAIANAAREAAASEASTTAQVSGNRDVSDFAIGAVGTVFAGATLTFSFTDANGDAVTTDPANGEVTLAADEDINTIVENINAIRDDAGNAVIEASLDANGQLVLNAAEGLSFNLSIEESGGADLAISEDLAFTLGFGGMTQTDGTAAVALSVSSGAEALTSRALFSDGAGEVVATRTTALSDLNIAGGGDVFRFNSSGTASNDTFTMRIGLNGATTADIEIAGDTTLGGLIDLINDDNTLKGNIRAEFDEETGQISLNRLDSSITSIDISAQAETTTALGTGTQLEFNLAFGGLASNVDSGTTDATDTPVTSDVRSVRFSTGDPTDLDAVARFEKDFDAIRSQIDQLVKDAGYRGINLLNGGVLETAFNETRTSILVSTGSTLTAEGLGINKADFSSRDKVDAALTEIRAALTAVREFGSSLANDLSVIQTRQDFTSATINTLTEGADKLTLADQNEEGAKMLALQTRQQLGVVSLSLASQAQQSVLRLF